jgi:hypothetical protein
MKTSPPEANTTPHNSTEHECGTATQHSKRSVGSKGKSTIVMLTSARRKEKEILPRRITACEEILRASRWMASNESQTSRQFFSFSFSYLLPFAPIGF